MPKSEFLWKLNNGIELYRMHYSLADLEAREAASANSALFDNISLRAATPDDFSAIEPLFKNPAFYVQVSFGKAIKRANFEQVSDRIAQRSAAGQPAITEQIVVLEKDRILGFARFQHQPESELTRLSHMFAISSLLNEGVQSPVTDDPKPVYPSIAGILERAASERAVQQGIKEIIMDTGRNDTAFHVSETFKGYSFKQGAANPGILTKKL